MFMYQRARAFRKDMHDSPENYFVGYLSDKIRKEFDRLRRIEPFQGQFNTVCLDAHELVDVLSMHFPRKRAKALGFKAAFIAGGNLEHFPGGAVWTYDYNDGQDDVYIDPAALAEGLGIVVDALGLDEAA